MTPRFPILMYHQIGPPPPRGVPGRSLTVPTADFVAQMRWLKRLGYRGVSMRDLMPYLKGEKQGRAVGITFDDGFRNVHANAMPVLAELGFTATNYFVSREIGGSNVWDRAKGIPAAECMSKTELLDRQAAGHEVGAHTLTHPRLTEISPDEAAREIADVRAELEAICGEPVEAFCYPHGAVDETIRRLVAQSGYGNATTTMKGRARASDDPLLLPRITVRRGHPWPLLLLKCLTA